MEIINDLLLKCPRNTITHIQLETIRDMILHGNYSYASELLRAESVTLLVQFPTEYHKMKKYLSSHPRLKNTINQH